MTSPSVIIYFPIFFWLLPPFKQYKTRFFKFFIILAITDLLYYGLGCLFNLQILSVYFYDYLSFFLFLSLQTKQNLIKYKWPIIFVLFMIFFVNAEFPLAYGYKLVLIFHFLIILSILKIIVLYARQYQKLNMFHFVFLFYEISIVVQFFFLFDHQALSTLMTSIFEILIALYFTFFTEKNSFKLSI